MVNSFFTILSVVAIYANLSVIAQRFHGVPFLVASVLPLLLVVPLFNRVVLHRERFIIDRTFIFMLGLLGVLLAASLFAKDASVAMTEIARFIAEGLLLYLLVINVVRDWPTMRQVMWTVLITAAVLGALNLYQEVTQTYTNELGGLSMRTLRDTDGTLLDPRYDFRAYGPVGEANRYAQILLVLLPLAFLRFWQERSISMKALAVVTGLLISCGVLLTYSRGGFLAIVAMMFMMMVLRLVSFKKAAALAGVGAIAILLLAPGYAQRIASLGDTSGYVMDDPGADPDTSIRGRLTAMRAGINAFMDHPMMGVGPGQYAKYYSISYQLDPDILDPHVAYRHFPDVRRTHDLFIEIAAETGFIGLIAFVAILISLMVPLYRSFRRLESTHPEFSTTAIALWLGIVGYLIAGLFLHLAFQRYYWFLLALGGAALQIFRNADPQSSES